MKTMNKRTFMVALGGMLLASLFLVHTADAATRQAGARAGGRFGAGLFKFTPRAQRQGVSQPREQRWRPSDSSYRTNRRYRSGSSYTGPKKPWQYPKTDPRRNRI